MTNSKTFYVVDLDNFKSPSIQKVELSGSDLNEAFNYYKNCYNLEVFDSLESAVYFTKRSLSKEQLRLDQLHYNLRYLTEDTIDVQKVNIDQLRRKKK